MGPPSQALVLVVEDNIELQELMRRLLALRGYNAVTADDGLDALAYLRGGGRASAIVLDIHMPNMDGWEFRHALQADVRFARIPIVIFSADPPVEEDDGIVSSLRKGTTDPELLLETIARACERGA
jgi:CheY-like chemotaxis protein